MKNYLKLIVALLFATNVFGQNLPSYLPKDGLVGWWPFNGNANDESGNGNHGKILKLNSSGFEINTDFNLVSGIDRFGKQSSALLTKNYASNVQLPITNNLFKSNFTFSIWSKIDSVKSEYPSIVESETNNFTIQYTNFNNELKISSYMTVNNVSPFGEVISPITYKNWNLITVVNENYINKFYINGKLVYTAKNSNKNQGESISNFIRVGNGIQLPQCSFYGVTDDISIYNRALSETEIQSLYTGTPITQNLPSYLPKDGLVGWWPFNGNANDESGNGNHGTVNGATLTSDRNGNENKAYNFDGITNHIRIKNSNTLNNKSVSINGWFRASNLATDDFKGAKGIVSKWWQYPSVCDENYNAFLVCLTKPTNINQTVFGAATNFYAGNQFVSDTITLNTWIHFVFTHDNFNGGKLYLNGKLFNSNDSKGEICNSINDLIFGADIINGSVYRNYNGQLDDIAIYNRALTEAEIQALYTGTPLCTTPPTPKVNPTVTTCAGNSISIEATGAAGVETYNWYDVAEGGTPIATSQIFKTPVLNYGENKTYWVSITNGVCEGTRARVDVVVKELPTVKKTENYSVCAGDFIQSLNFALTPQGATNYWSNDNTTIGLPSSGMGALPGFKTPSNINTPIVSNITVTPSFNGCIGKSETFKIYVISTPKVAITNLKPIVYTSDAPIALVGEPVGGTFTGEAIVGTIFTPAKATLGKKSISYKYVSKDGCGGSAIASTIVVDTNGVVCTKYDTITVKETIYDTVLKITFKLTTGINISKTTSLSVYPNPTADNLIIDAADVAAMNGYRYQLMDALGKEIYSQLVTSKKTEISLKTLGAKGVYVLHVLDANNQSVVSKKIVLE